MPKAWFHIRGNQRGFSPVEVLLAATIFGFLVTALIGAIVYGRSSTATSGDRVRANLLAEEGVEAVRNIRDAAYTNLADGTYGLTQSSNHWVLSGSQDVSDIFTRQVIIASDGTDRKRVTSTVTWPQGVTTSQTALVTRLTNWSSSIVKSWNTPAVAGTYDASGTNDAIKVATQGNYAYLVRNDGTPDFIILNISNPANPTLVGSLSLSGAPTNIAVNGNYAYVSSTLDSGELQIINISNPASPSVSGLFNAAGTSDGMGVYAVGTTVYLVRMANGSNNEFVMINAATPSVPVRTAYLNLNINMREVYANLNDVYIVTESDTQEIVEFSTFILGLITTSSSINLPGTANATTIAGFNKTLVVGQGTTLYTVDGGIINTVLGSTVLPGTINDVTLNAANTIAYVGTSFTTGELQVVNIANTLGPAISGAADITGTDNNLNGVAYSGTLDVVAGANSSDTREAVIFVPN